MAITFKTKLARLEKLLESLLIVKRKRKPFNMSVWAQASKPQPGKRLPRNAAECGTAACAAGWYKLLAKPKGFKFSVQNFYGCYELIGRHHHFTFHDLGEHFGIGIREAVRIFCTTEYLGDPSYPSVPVSAVIERVKQLIKDTKATERQQQKLKNQHW